MFRQQTLHELCLTLFSMNLLYEVNSVHWVADFLPSVGQLCGGAQTVSSKEFTHNRMT